MDASKTRGDILAERIEAIKSDFDGLQGLSEILGEALAEYRKPEWTLGQMSEDKCVICGGNHNGLPCDKTRITGNRPTPETDALCGELHPLVDGMTASTVIKIVLTKARRIAGGKQF